MALRAEIRRNPRSGRKKNDVFRIYSRNLKPLEHQFPEIAAELKQIPAQEFLLDGEIVALDEQGRSRFQLLQSRINRRSRSGIEEARREITVRYMVFDLIACEGYDLRKVTLRERKRILKALLPESDLIREVDTLSGVGEKFYQLVCEQALEGIVAKDAGSTYQSRRTPSWLKVKCTRQQTFVIGGFSPPAGSRKYFGALLLGLFEGEKLVYVGRVGTGFGEETLESIHDQLTQREAEVSPLAGVPKEVKNSTWVKPELVCEVKFNEWTQDRILRAPSFIGLRRDIDPADCQFEQPQEFTQFASAEEDLDQYPFLSNMDKIFWPEEGYTKRDLVAYYHRIAPVLLPYLEDRPMNLERYPDGYSGKSFYQKDAPDFFPEWIRTVRIDSDSKEKANRYIVCNSRDTLVYLANLACIPLHPWSSRIDTIGCPDFMIIDLDPDPKAAFAQVCRVALKVRQILEQVGLTSFPKTSGSKGLHILVPLEPVHVYRSVRGFAEIVARLTVQGLEEIATFERSMKARKGKIYVDFLQNGMGKTIVSPYCVRPRPGAPVSTPLEWDEVGPGLRPEAFHIKNVFRRIERKGDLFKGVLTERQRLGEALQRLEQNLKGE